MAVFYTSSTKKPDAPSVEQKLQTPKLKERCRGLNQVCELGHHNKNNTDINNKGKGEGGTEKDE